MKKVLRITRFGTPLGPDHQVVAFRRKGTLFFNNIEFHPSSRFKFEVNEETGEVTIRFPLNETEQLTIGNEAGLAEKIQIEGKKS